MGETQIVSQVGKIAYYKGQSEFVVSDLKDNPPLPSKPAIPTSEDPNAHTSASLKRMSKEDLSKLGAEYFELELGMDMRKDDMVLQILEAQG